MTRKPRRLSAEEQRLWQQITRSTTPLERKPSKIEDTAPIKPVKPAATTSHVAPFRLGEKAKHPKSDTRMILPDQPLRMDRKSFARLKRGKSTPEARLDLHGMTVDVAHSALRAFLLRSHGEGKRLVLVITGKGRVDDLVGLSDIGRGILRRHVPHWLDQPPLRQIVQQVVQAHQKHGGSGALYVYLRR